MVKGTVKECKTFEAGEYTGIVKENKLRVTPQGYEYHETFIEIESEGKPYTFKCGVPSSISERTKLGKLLATFGCPILDLFDKEIDTDDYIKGPVLFSMMVKKTDSGEFNEIVTDTLRPAKKK